MKNQWVVTDTQGRQGYYRSERMARRALHIGVRLAQVVGGALSCTAVGCIRYPSGESLTLMRAMDDRTLRAARDGWFDLSA